MSDDRLIETAIPYTPGSEITITIRLTEGGCDIAVRPRESFAAPAESEDALQCFLAARCQRAPTNAHFASHYECRADHFRREFEDYCRGKNLPVLASRTLGTNLKKLGIHARKSAGKTIYCGLKLLPVAG